VQRIVRLNNDGSIDNTFNTGTGFNGTTFSGLIDDGKILVVGGFFEYNGQTNRQIAKLNSDGSMIIHLTQEMDLPDLAE
jgi:hypothetical protein